MVKFYDMKVEECNGMLVFVLKMDEAQLVKGNKFERVIINLMNTALQHVHGKKVVSSP